MADSSIARLEAQVEIKADVEKYYGFLRNNMHRLVQMFPQNIKSFQILDGDEVRAGCLTLWKYDLVEQEERDKRFGLGSEGMSRRFGLGSEGMTGIGSILQEVYSSPHMISACCKVPIRSRHKSKESILWTPMTAKIKIEDIDDGDMTITFNFIQGDVLRTYKSFKSKFRVLKVHLGAGSVEWTMEFEKANVNAPDPEEYVNFAVKMSKGLDAYLCKN